MVHMYVPFPEKYVKSLSSFRFFSHLEGGKFIKLANQQPSFMDIGCIHVTPSTLKRVQREDIGQELIQDYLLEHGSSSEHQRSDTDGMSSREESDINRQLVMDPEDSR